MKKKIYMTLFFLGICFFPQATSAQEKEPLSKILNQDNLGNVNDKFQEYFFEALKQKAIGNHEKAINALEKCIELKPKEAILYVELGKNHKALEQYAPAEKYIKKALEKRPESPYVRIELYEIYAATKNYPEALRVVKRLVHFNPDYYEDMANLYMMVKKPALALNALKTLDSLKGPSAYSKRLRREIFAATNNRSGQISYLKTQIAKNPENQENYLRLIDLYGEKNEFEEAFLWAKKLQAKYPNSARVHLALYQLYFSKKEYDKAIASMKKVLSSKDLEEKTKVKVLKDFVAFTQKHAEYENALIEVLDLAMKTGESMASNKELGDFYLHRDKEKALEHYEKALQNNFNDVKTIENTVLLQLDLKQYKNAAILSKKALGIFPSRPKLYLSQGVALNQLKKYTEALKSLEFGLGYLIDNPRMKADFYTQMAKAHQGLLQQEKVALYEKKAAALKTKLE